MSSEAVSPGGAAGSSAGAAPGSPDAASSSAPEVAASPSVPEVAASPSVPDVNEGQLELRDPAVMRALAHPLRWALLEALLHAGTLTATQAGEILGETPANCAFHLRTLARYGLVEEAGGGRGRERPWRRVNRGLNLTTAQDDPQVAAAAEVLDEFWTTRTLDRAGSALRRKRSWPAEWLGTLGEYQTISYITPAEAKELQELLYAALGRYRERNADPSLRPPGALPIEYLLLSYPLLDLASRGVPMPPAAEAASAAAPANDADKDAAPANDADKDAAPANDADKDAGRETNPEKELPL